MNPAAPAGAKRVKAGQIPAAALRRFGPLLALVLLCAVMGVVSADFLTVEDLLNVFRQSAVNALLALGQLVVIITAGIDLSVGSIRGFCCVMAALMVKSGVPPLLSILGVLALGAGSVVGIPAPVILVIAVCAAFSVFLKHTTAGRDLYAIGGNKQAARVSSAAWGR